MYTYSLIEYAQTLSFSFFDAAALSMTEREIFESLLSIFFASFVYPEIALRSKHILSSLLVLK